METFGQRIRRLRKERGLTQQELAGDVVTGSMISQIEADRAAPSYQVMVAIAEKLNVDPSEIRDDVLVKTDQTSVYRKAKQRMEAEQFSDALPLLLGLIHPVAQFREEVIQHDLVECYENLRMFDEAASMMLKLIAGAFARDDVETVAHTYYRLAQFERKRDRLFLARKYLIQAVELMKRHPELDMPLAGRMYTLLGRVCLALHLRREALAAYESAISLTVRNQSDVNRASVYHGMASLYMETEQYDLAVKALDFAIVHYLERDDQKTADLCLINKAVIKRHQKNYQEALVDIADLVKMSRFQEDETLIAQCKAEEALTHFARGSDREAYLAGTTALSLQLPWSHQHELYTMLLNLLLQEANWNEAERIFQSAVEACPEVNRNDLVNLEALHIRCLTAQHAMVRAAEAAKHLIGRFVESAASTP